MHEAVIAGVDTIIEGVQMARAAQRADDAAAFKRADTKLKLGNQMVGAALGDIARAAARG